MTDLIIRKTNRLSMSGGSSVKSVSTPSGFALIMSFGATATVTLKVQPVNTIVIESDLIIVIRSDYDSISINNCIGTSIQIHGPPMVDNRPYLHSFTVFTETLKKDLPFQTNNFIKNNSRCGYSVGR